MGSYQSSASMWKGPDDESTVAEYRTKLPLPVKAGSCAASPSRQACDEPGPTRDYHREITSSDQAQIYPNVDFILASCYLRRFYTSLFQHCSL